MQYHMMYDNDKYKIINYTYNDNGRHGELGPPQTCRVEAGAGSDHDGTRNMSRGVNLLYCTVFIQVSNRGRFCQYISLPMKYTVSGSTLQYKVGLTLSFLSLISRGVGGIQKGNTSIYSTVC